MFSKLFSTRATGLLRQSNRLSRGFSTASGSPRGGFLYNTFFKTNSRYLLFIFTGAAIGEAIYSYLGDAVWNMNNRGKLYDDIDWSKWESLYVEEEEEEEEEDDEE